MTILCVLFFIGSLLLGIHSVMKKDALMALLWGIASGANFLGAIIHGLCF